MITEKFFSLNNLKQSTFHHHLLIKLLYMYRAKKIQQTISSLKSTQQAGASLEEAIESLHVEQNIAFDDIWPAIMKIRQLSEKQAMQLTKECCGYWKKR